MGKQECINSSASQYSLIIYDGVYTKIIHTSKQMSKFNPAHIFQLCTRHMTRPLLHVLVGGVFDPKICSMDHSTDGMSPFTLTLQCRITVSPAMAWIFSDTMSRLLLENKV
ncbi:hypothetical protein F7725_004867 [Dissostichus mawsoni]|uniref:Uncharacterized protein n=1 Tax=Dissostichus mawsoni TaxID=36200 RepID=A0A7J5XKP9_DISMA|nr:hypothetical protein F7725_004867 [Dissostichus mawsoni]